MAGVAVIVNISTTARKIEVVFFDVGHGDAALVSLPNGRNLLIDTGNKSRYSDQAKRVILPYLTYRGIKRIDDVVISHPHRDHAGGLSSLIQAVEIGRVVCSRSAIPTLRDMFAIPEGASIELPQFSAVTAGDTLMLDPSTRIRVLSPTAALAKHTNLNEASVVIHIQFGQKQFLFLGDAELESESALIQNFPTFLYADVVKIAHHGSSTSSHPSLVSNVASRSSGKTLAVVSVGANTGYGLPDESVLFRWQHAGAILHVTDQSGALWISSDGNSIQQIFF